ncbi:MAG: hypothetical protein IJP41_05465 [Synergistaceae bacterium]|nr:hypothetical protein [Synergistaceae bacterium]
MKKIISVALVLVMVFAVSAFADGMPGGIKLIFTTGGAQVTFYVFGGFLAGMIG